MPYKDSKMDSYWLSKPMSTINTFQDLEEELDDKDQR